MQLFEYVKSLTETKESIPKDEEPSYSPFMINRAFSMMHEAIYFADEMNYRANQTKRMHIDFWQNLLPKRRVYIKWAKSPKEDDDISIVREYYRCNRDVAMSYLDILTPEQLAEIRHRLFKGGPLDKKKKSK